MPPVETFARKAFNQQAAVTEMRTTTNAFQRTCPGGGSWRNICLRTEGFRRSRWNFEQLPNVQTVFSVNAPRFVAIFLELLYCALPFLMQSLQTPAMKIHLWVAGWFYAFGSQRSRSIPRNLNLERCNSESFRCSSFLLLHKTIHRFIYCKKLFSLEISFNLHFAVCRLYICYLPMLKSFQHRSLVAFFPLNNMLYFS